MIIDKALLDNGLTPKLLGELIARHEQNRGRFERLRGYYEGRHEILVRKKHSPNAANNKVVCNHAKYIVDMAQAYLVGAPVKYAAAKGCDITPIEEAYNEQDIASIDSELVKEMGIFGRSYELLYTDSEGKPRSAVIDPTMAFAVYSDECDRRQLLGVYYYKKFDLNGTVTGVVCKAYDDTHIYSYSGRGGSWSALELTGEPEEHYFGEVPLIEYMNNEERQGDFEQEIPLIDAYNILMSDRVNDKAQYVDSFLFISNMDVDSEQAEKLREERILLGFEGSDAKYLSQTLSEADTKVLRDDYKDDIHRFSMVPDLSDEKFGGNLSGVAIKYKLLGFEQLTKNRERYLKKSLQRRFELYNNLLAKSENMAAVPPYQVDIQFTRNLPVNNLETAQMLQYLDGTISQRTKIEQLEFISDADEEMKIFEDEQEKAMERQERMFAEPGRSTDDDTEEDGDPIDEDEER